MKVTGWKRVLVTLTCALSIFFAMAVTADATVYGGQSHGTVWSVDTDTGILLIDVSDAMGNWTRTSAPWYKYRSYIKHIEFEDATSFITPYAFSDLPYLEEIDLPNSIERIGDYAFLNDTSVQSLQLPLSVAQFGKYCFKDCTSLNYIVTENETDLNEESQIWNNAGTAGSGVTLVCNMTNVGAYAFTGLDTITSMRVEKDLRKVGDYAFYNCKADFAVDAGTAKYIGKYAFYNCENLNSIKISSVETVGDYAFYNCKNAAGTAVMPNVKEIGKYAFYNCKALTALRIDSAESIGEYAFSDCTGLTGTANCPNALSVGSYAFRNCTQVEEISLPSAMTIGAKAFYNASNAKKVVAGADGCVYGAGGESAFEGLVACEVLVLGGVVAPEVGSNFFNGLGTNTEFGCAIQFAKDQMFEEGSFTGDKTGMTGHIMISLPAGSTVDHIGEGAFKDNLAIYGADFSSVEGEFTFYRDAFNGCTNMRYLASNKGATTYYPRCFANLYNLQEFHYNTEYCKNTFYQWSGSYDTVWQIARHDYNSDSGGTANNYHYQNAYSVGYSGDPKNHAFYRMGDAENGGFNLILGKTVKQLYTTQFEGDFEAAYGIYYAQMYTSSWNHVASVWEDLNPDAESVFNGSYDVQNTTSGWFYHSDSFDQSSGVNMLSESQRAIKTGYNKYYGGADIRVKTIIAEDGCQVSYIPAGCFASMSNKGGLRGSDSYTNWVSYTGSSNYNTISVEDAFGTHVEYYPNHTGSSTNDSWTKYKSYSSHRTSGEGPALYARFWIPSKVFSYSRSQSYGYYYGDYTHAKNNENYTTSTSAAQDAERFDYYVALISDRVCALGEKTNGNTTSWGYGESTKPYTFWCVFPSWNGYIGDWNSNLLTAYTSNSTVCSIFKSPLTHIDLSGCHNLKLINSNAFTGNPKVRNVILPRSIQVIAPFAFNFGNYFTTTSDNDCTITLRGKTATSNMTYWYDLTYEGYSYGQRDGCNNRFNVQVETDDGDIVGLIMEKINAGTNVTAYLLDMTGEGEATKVAFVGSGTTHNFTAENPLFSASKTGEIDTVTMPNTVTSIGNYLFYNYGKLKDFQWSSGIASIGNGSFQGTAKLVEIPSLAALETIGNDAFRGSGVESIGEQVKLESIGNNAFKDTKLTELPSMSALEAIGDSAFEGSKLASTGNMPSLTSIGDAAFKTTKLEEFGSQNLGSLTSIGNEAFASTNITEATIPAAVTTIGEDVFASTPIATLNYNATAANDVTAETMPFGNIDSANKLKINIGNNVTTIPAYMFYDNKASEVNIGSGVSSIGFGAMNSMENATIKVSKDNATYAIKTDDSSLYAGNTLVLYNPSTKDEAYAIPTYAYHIGEGAAYGHDYLRRVAFGGTIQSIGANAFANNDELSTIAISDFMDSASFESEVNPRGENWYGTATIIYSGLDWDIGAVPGQMTATMYSDGSLIITGSGAMKNWASANSVEWASKRASITSVKFEGDITSIGAYAFYGATSLENVSLPDSLTSIGQYAFYGCKKLKAVSIPDGVKTINTYTFGECTNLGFVDVGTGVETIETFAFAGCTDGQFVSIGGNVKAIKTNAFKDCTGLTVLVLGKHNAFEFEDRSGAPEQIQTSMQGTTGNVARVLWLYDIANGNVVKRYPGNTSAVSIQARLDAGESNRSSVADLWGYAYDTDGDGKTDYMHFSGANSMDTITNAEAVYWNDVRDTLRGVRLDDDVTSIGAYTFSDCPNLEFIRIGKACRGIGVQAFRNDPSLKEFNCDAIEISGEITTASEIFYGSGSSDGFAVVFNDNATLVPAYLFYNCANVSSIVLGDSVKTIKSGSFVGCTNLSQMYMKSSAETITSEKNAFSDAGRQSGGFSVQIAAQVQTIPNQIFYSDDGNPPFITSVTTDAGSKLKNIASSAFKGCNRLASVSFAGCTLLQSVGSEAFNGCTRLVSADFSDCVSLAAFGPYSFNECINLSGFNIDNCESITTFDSYSFNKCGAIPTLVLPESVKYVEDHCFYDWNPSQIIFILGKSGEQGFNLAGGRYGTYWSGEGAKKATLVYSTASWDVTDTEKIDPSTGEAYAAKSVQAFYCPLAGQETLFVTGKGPMKGFETNSGNWAFLGTDFAMLVKAINIQDGVTHIGQYAFAGMANAKSLRVGSNVVVIDKFAFQGDSSIPEVDLTRAAANLTNIREGAFDGCSGVSTVNLSGCDALQAIDTNAFRDLSGSSLLYVSSDYWYDYLTFNASGKIDSTYGTTNNTTVVMVRVYFSQNLASQGVMQGQPVTWHVETTSQTGGTTFKWYFAAAGAEQGDASQWTEITTSMQGYRIVSTENTSDLYMDASIVTMDKSGYYFYCEANSPFYDARSNIATLAVYSAAITPIVNVYDRNSNPLESNTWTQGPLTISITPGEEAEAQGASYQYKLKSSGSWKNTEAKMSYDTEGIVTMYVRAIINGDSNTASPAIKFILKVDNSAPTVSNITADPEVGATDSVTLTATATDNISGVNSVNWYKAAEDTSGSGVKGYVPIIENKDMYYMVIEVKEFVDEDGDGTYNENFYRTRYDGQNASVLETETYSKTGVNAEVVTDADTLANIEAATNIIKTQANSAGTISRFKLYEIHVGDLEDDYEISASDKGVVIIPIPDGYVTRNASGKITENRMVVYTFNSSGVLTPITRYNVTSNGTGLVIPISRFGQYLIAEKAPEELP